MKQTSISNEGRSLLFAPPGTRRGAQMRVLRNTFRDGRPCVEFRMYERKNGTLVQTRAGLALTLAEFDAVVRLVRDGIAGEPACAA